MQRFPERLTGLALAVAIIAATTLAGSPVLAGSDILEGGVVGNWCSMDGGERLYIEETSVGFNDHTICDPKEPLSPGPLVKEELSCANIYIHGNEIIRAFERNLTFKAELIADGQLEVTMKEEGEPPQSTRYRRCNN